MLNEDVRLGPVSDEETEASGTNPAPAGATWLFRDGEFQAGPFVPGSSSRTMEFSGLVSRAMALEFHDKADNTEVVEPVEIKPALRPILVWNSVPNAVTYRIFHRKDGDADEELIWEESGIEDIPIQRIECPVELAGALGVYHFLRVESVDLFGDESTRESWVIYVMDLPPVPVVTVAAGSGPGLYDITIGD